jgi:hypothetical protein
LELALRQQQLSLPLHALPAIIKLLTRNHPAPILHTCPETQSLAQATRFDEFGQQAGYLREEREGGRLVGHCASGRRIWVLGLDDDDLVGKGGVREEEREEETDAAATCYHYRKVIVVVWFF